MLHLYLTPKRQSTTDSHGRACGGATTEKAFLLMPTNQFSPLGGIQGREPPQMNAVHELNCIRRDDPSCIAKLFYSFH